MGTVHKETSKGALALGVGIRSGLKSRSSCPGFTLVELLVAICIVAVLAVLVMNMAQRYIKEAQRTVCTQQLGQVYGALRAYSVEHYGRFPRCAIGSMDDPGFDTWGRGGVWYDNSIPANGVSAYVGGPDPLYRLIVCPANRASNPPAMTRTPYGFPYICNYELMTQNGNSSPPPYLGSIDTAKCILLVDAGIGADWKGPGFTSYAGWERMKERHGERMNVLWADGHISWMRSADIKKSDILPIPR